MSYRISLTEETLRMDASPPISSFDSELAFAALEMKRESSDDGRNEQFGE